MLLYPSIIELWLYHGKVRSVTQWEPFFGGGGGSLAYLAIVRFLAIR